MDIPTDGHGRIHALDIGLFNEDLSRSHAEVLDLRLGQGTAVFELLDLPCHASAHAIIQTSSVHHTY